MYISKLNSPNTKPESRLNIKNTLEPITNMTEETPQMQKSTTDKIYISEEYKSYLIKNNEIPTEEDMLKKTFNKNEYFNIESLKELAKEKSTELERTDVYNKCFTIAMRIAGGDKVPYKDEKFLAENASDLYARAIMLRIQKMEPVEHKSILKHGDIEKSRQRKTKEMVEDMHSLDDIPNLSPDCQSSSSTPASTEVSADMPS